MDPFFQDANASKLLETAEAVLLMLALVGLAIAISERAFGLDIRRAVDRLEELSQNGTPWPLTALLIAGMFAIVWLVR